MGKKPRDPNKTDNTNSESGDELEPAPLAEQPIEIESASSDNEVTPATEVAPAGGTAPVQREWNLTDDLVRREEADRRFLHETREKHVYRIGPMEVIVYTHERAPSEIQAAGTQLLRFIPAGLGTAVVSAFTAEMLAAPSGLDLLFIGGGTGGSVVLIGVAYTIYRIRRRKR
jgi:hypothetical protein